MNILWAIFLGIIQGITEILPISSSAHLVLAPWFFKVPDQGLSFDVALHLGSLGAILFAFRGDWLEILKSTKGLITARLKPQTQSQKMIYLLGLASIPGALAGYFLDDLAESTLRSPLIIVGTLIFYGVVLILVDRFARKFKSFEKVGIKESVLIGLAQVLALVPGTSRSGVTITAGLLTGLNKEAAAKFSFMISAPIILGAGLVKIPDIPTAEIMAPYFWIGLFSAFISALWAIKFILKYVKTHSYNIFAYYRFGLAILILIIMGARW